MSKTVKTLLYFISILMLVLSVKWYFKNKEDEPLISILGQFSALLVLMFENKIGTSVSAKKNKKTYVDVDASKGDKVNVNKNEDSEIKIKTRD